MPTIESTGTDEIELRLLRVPRPRHEERARATSATRMIGTLTRKTDPYQKWPSSQPLATGPMAPAPPVDAGPDGDRLGPLLGPEDVDQDRQRRRHDERGGGPHQGAAGDQLPHRSRGGRERRPDEEPDQAELQRALAAEAVADRAGGEQQAGEHERVGRDDPLELRRRRVELA